MNETSVREDLELAIKEVEHKPETPSTVIPGTQSKAGAPAEVDPEAKNRTPVDSTEPKEQNPEQAEKGKQPEKVLNPPNEGADKESPNVVQNTGISRKPVSWKSDITDSDWNAIPESAKSEIVRREQEITRGLQSAAESKKIAEGFVSAIKPYAGQITELNQNPFAVVSNLLSTVQKLRTAPAAEKAGIVAEIVNSYGVDIKELDNALASKFSGDSASKQPDIGALIDEKLRPVHEAAHHQMMATVKREVDTFLGDPKHEFLTDSVRNTMAELLRMAAHQGIEITLEQAYNRACSLDPEVVKEKLRRDQELRNEQVKEAQRSNSAAVSPSSSQSPGVKSQVPFEEMSLRDQLISVMRSQA